MKDLGLPIGQKVLLRELVIKLRASSGDVRHERDDEATTDQMVKGQDDSTKNDDTDDEMEISEEQFWCVFKCLGGISAVGICGILTLIGLVTFGLPVIGFGATGSLAAKIMALYGGNVAAGSVVSVLQSVAAVGIGWKAILGAFFGSAAVMTAIKQTFSHCMDQ
ncbi:hypothetical protein ACJMK2_026801 [Sinanodonta woodiana]|uniref:Uncharacterized protein n=1 Tax=Sinanodonta woodiana TaxID=1069815 RepID=A0ABD3XKW4_SINWO